MATLLSSGTLQQCGSAIDHLKRIIKHKAPSLNQQNAKRRVPRFVSLCVLYKKPIANIAITFIQRYYNFEINEKSSFSSSRGFPPDGKLCLSDVVLWLLEQCGRPQTACRHKCMELFYEFIPLLPGEQSHQVLHLASLDQMQLIKRGKKNKLL